MKKSFVGLILFVIMLLAGAQAAKAGCCFVYWDCSNKEGLTVVSNVYRTRAGSVAECISQVVGVNVALNNFIGSLKSGLKENTCTCSILKQDNQKLDYTYSEDSCSGIMERLPRYEEAIKGTSGGSDSTINPNHPVCGEPKSPSFGIGCCEVKEMSSISPDPSVSAVLQEGVHKAYMTTQTDCESNIRKRSTGLAGNWTETTAEWDAFLTPIGKECKKATTGGGETTPPEEVTPKKEPLNLSYDSLTNPLLTVDAAVVIGRVIKAILSIIGSIFLAMLVYGGFIWMTAAGNEKKVATGRTTLMWAAIGLITIFLAWILVALVLEAVGFS